MQGAAQTGRCGHRGDIREPMRCNGSTLARNARDVGSIPSLVTIFPIFVTPMTLVAVTMILYKLCAAWLLNLPCVCKCKVIVCMYIIVRIERLTIPEGQV